MKVFARFLFLSAAIAVIAGCATQKPYAPELPPGAQAKLKDYFQRPGNKIFLVAIDPCGDYAYAYAYGKATLKEAAEEATLKCDAQRHAHNVLAKPYIYAINDEVVYDDVVARDQMPQ